MDFDQAVRLYNIVAIPSNRSLILTWKNIKAAADYIW